MIRIQVSHISWMNFDYNENGGNKAFLTNPKQQYNVSQRGEHDCHANNKKNGDCCVPKFISFHG